MVEIKRTVTEDVLTSDGQALNIGDRILIKVGNQFVLTEFMGLDRGYIVTKNLDNDIVKYRKASISRCLKVVDFSL